MSAAPPFNFYLRVKMWALKVFKDVFKEDICLQPLIKIEDMLKRPLKTFLKRV